MVMAITDEKLRLFKAEFRNYCKQAEVTQRQLADVLGMSYSYFSDKLNCSHNLPFFTPKQVAQIIDYLAKSEAFYTEEEKLELLRLAYPIGSNQTANEWFRRLIKVASEPPALSPVKTRAILASGKSKAGARSKPNSSVTTVRKQKHVSSGDNLFIAREKELKEITGMLTTPQGLPGSTRLVTLSGIGGVGKTRLALELVSRFKTQRLFKHGVKFVDLSNISGGQETAWQVAQVVELDLPAGVLSELDIAGKLETLTALLSRHIHTKSMLIVLDNFEQLLNDATAGLVASLLTNCPNLRIIITSREILRIRHERVIRLKGLTVPPESERDLATIADYPAVTLLVARLQEIQGDFELTAENAPLLAHICRLLSGLPLALEIAARHIEYFSLERLRDILVAELEGRTGGQGFSFLTSCLGSLRSEIARHRTLQASMDDSFTWLSSHEKKLLGFLARLRGNFSLETVTANRLNLQGESELIPQKNVVELFSSLVDKSLIQVETVAGGLEAGTRQAHALYKIPDLIARYSQNWLPEIVDREQVSEIAAFENAAEITVAEIEQAGINPAGSKILPVAITRRKKTALEFISTNAAFTVRTVKTLNREGFNTTRPVNCGLSPPVQYQG